jgi:DDE superfamily endonuclease
MLCCVDVLVSVSAQSCSDVATPRRKFQKAGGEHVLFLDETAMRVSEAPTYTVVLPGESAYVVVDETTAYAKRFDMIACCTGKEVLPPIVYSPTARSEASSKGINTKMLITYIQTLLAQAVGALDRFPMYLVLDRASCHNEQKIIEAFNDNGCQELVEVWKMPTKAAKRMSPLDNALFHDWKERVRNRGPIHESNIEQQMADEWNNLPTRLLQSHYQHCGLVRWQDPYFDCPQPTKHAHDT